MPTRAAITLRAMLAAVLMRCVRVSQGAWSIGVFKGSSPLALQPSELLRPRADVPGAWPVANPVLTCASITGGFPSFTSKHAQRYDCKHICGRAASAKSCGD